MSALPAGWVEAALGEITDTSLGKMLDAKQATGQHPTPYLRNVNVRWGTFDLSDVAMMDIRPEEMERVLAREGDVVACEGGEPGRAAVWRHSAPVALQKALHRIRPAAGITPEFLAFVLQAHAASGALAALFTGTTIKHLPQERLRLVRVPVPPTAEQEWIVTAIEEAFSKLDAGEAGLRAVRQRLRRMRDSVLAAAVAGQLVPQDPADAPASELLSGIGVKPVVDDSSPGTWASCRVGDILTQPLANGRSVRSLEGGFPVLRLTCLREGRVDLAERKPGEWTAEAAQQFLVRRGDFLVSRGNGSLKLVGRGGLVTVEPDPVAYPDTLIRVRVNPAVLAPELLPLWWNSQVVRRQVESQARTTAGIYKINQTMIGDVTIPLPPLAEQKRIVAEVDRQFSFVEAAERAVDAGLARSAALRRSVLKAAFEGRLVPQDPSDEPASILLERIRADRAATSRVGRARSRSAT